MQRAISKPSISRKFWNKTKSLMPTDSSLPVPRVAGGPNSSKQASQTREGGRVRELHFIVRLRRKSNSLKRAVEAGFTYSFEVDCKHLCFMIPRFSLCFFLMMF
jgi:hypothetical protein